MGKHSAFSRRLRSSGLTARDVAFLTRVSLKRIRQHSAGVIELRPEELERINQTITNPGHRVVWSRKLEPLAPAETTLALAAAAAN